MKRVNKARAEQARDTLQYFADNHGEPIVICGSDGWRQNAVDLLSNLAHFCDREQLSLSDLLRQAKGHYQAEAEGSQEFSSLS